MNANSQETQLHVDLTQLKQLADEHIMVGDEDRDSDYSTDHLVMSRDTLTGDYLVQVKDEDDFTEEGSSISMLVSFDKDLNVSTAEIVLTGKKNGNSTRSIGAKALSGFVSNLLHSVQDELERAPELAE